MLWHVSTTMAALAPHRSAAGTRGAVLRALCSAAGRSRPGSRTAPAEGQGEWSHSTAITCKSNINFSSPIKPVSGEHWLHWNLRWGEPVSMVTGLYFGKCWQPQPTPSRAALPGDPQPCAAVLWAGNKGLCPRSRLWDGTPAITPPRDRNGQKSCRFGIHISTVERQEASAPCTTLFHHV